MGPLLCRFHDLRGRTAARAKSKAPLGNIGAGNIKFQRVNAIHVKHSSQFAIFGGAVPVNVHDDFCVIRPQLGQCFLKEDLYAGVFKTHTVKDSRRGLNDALSLVAGPGMKGRALYRNGSYII